MKTQDLLHEMGKNARKIWDVYVDGEYAQAVGATDNKRETATKYAQSKYPGKFVELIFREWKEK